MWLLRDRLHVKDTREALGMRRMAPRRFQPLQAMDLALAFQQACAAPVECGAESYPLFGSGEECRLSDVGLKEGVEWMKLIPMLTIFVVSDATGETAERMVRSALVQFETSEIDVLRRGHICDRAQVRAVVKEAAARRAIILHTLVSDELRDLMLAQARRHNVDSMDLMGPLLDRLAYHLNLTPKEKPGLFKQLIQAKSRTIEAVEFAFRHDDGARPGDLDRAEAVLVGVSRTMKTPTMLYLAYQGWFVANVPIVPELEIPAQLLALPAQRVFCFDMNPSRLLELREVRADATRIPREPYASLPHIRRELQHALSLSAERGWRLIDVTGKSVEEVAREIIALLGNVGDEPKRKR